MIKWTLQKRKIKDLKPHFKNPRKISDYDAKNLKQSLEKFGVIDKPIIDQNNHIIGGHQRLSILKKMGIKEIECYVPEDNLEQKDIDELNIRLNRNIGEWDYDILSNQWEINDLLEWGFTKEELFSELPAQENVEEDNEVFYPPKDPKTQLGDIYDIGSHRIICGDSTRSDVVGNLLGDIKSQLMVTDPPYGVKRDKGFGGFGGFGKPIKRREYKDDWDSERPSKETFDLIIAKAKLSIIWGGNFFADILPQSSHWIVWDKKQTMPTFGDCELAWTNSHRKSVKKYEIEYNGLIGKEKERFHPTQKPILLFLELIKDYSNENDSIFDPFLGSGTTLIAAEQHNRICYGIELDPAYCDIIVQRWIKYRHKLGKDAKVLKNGIVYEGFDEPT